MGVSEYARECTESFYKILFKKERISKYRLVSVFEEHATCLFIKALLFHLCPHGVRRKPKTAASKRLGRAAPRLSSDRAERACVPGVCSCLVMLIREAR